MEEGFIDIMRETKLPEDAVDYITKNPEGLTKEGCLVSINQWKYNSRNKYNTKKYEEMIKRCKNFTNSGKLSDGKTILSRNADGGVTWAEYVDEKYNVLVSKLT